MTDVSSKGVDWRNEPAPEELLAGNPYVAGTIEHLQWKLGTTTRWRLERMYPTPNKSGEDSGLMKGQQ